MNDNVKIFQSKVQREPETELELQIKKAIKEPRYENMTIYQTIGVLVSIVHQILSGEF